MNDRLPAQRGGAKALLLTVLGEFVLPRGGSAWTTSLVSAAGALGIAEKNARQALTRIRDQGLTAGERQGRAVRWTLTQRGRELLESGAERIYDFGREPAVWRGEWLVAHCPVPEDNRTARNQLRTQLGFLGFGELSASLLISPHVDREPRLVRVLTELDLFDGAVVWHSRTGGHDDDVRLAAKAWDLDDLAAAYRSFGRNHGRRSQRPDRSDESFAAVVELVHDWRRFPSIDPELPGELLPADWAGVEARAIFDQAHRSMSPDAQRWFDQFEPRPAASPSSRMS